MKNLSNKKILFETEKVEKLFDQSRQIDNFLHFQDLLNVLKKGRMLCVSLEKSEDLVTERLVSISQHETNEIKQLIKTLQKTRAAINCHKSALFNKSATMSDLLNATQSNVNRLNEIIERLITQT